MLLKKKPSSQLLIKRSGLKNRNFFYATGSLFFTCMHRNIMEYFLKLDYESHSLVFYHNMPECDLLLCRIIVEYGVMFY